MSSSSRIGAMKSSMERARSLRAIADRQQCTEDEAAMLRELADEQQQRAEYDAWVRAEVEASLADPRPSLSDEEVWAHMEAMLDELEAEERAKKAEKTGRRAARANVRRAVAA